MGLFNWLKLKDKCNKDKIILPEKIHEEVIVNISSIRQMYDFLEMKRMRKASGHKLSSSLISLGEDVVGASPKYIAEIILEIDRHVKSHDPFKELKMMEKAILGVPLTRGRKIKELSKDNGKKK